MKSRYKILILVGLPLYGILISSLNTALLFLLNPGAMIIQEMASMPFFYNKSMYQYEWFTIPFFMIVSNLIFWVPVAILIRRYLEKRENHRRIENEK